MNKEQLVQEMTNEIFDNFNCLVREEEAKRIAKHLVYNADYRKQIVGEWVRQGDGTHYCSNCGKDATYTFDGTEICGITCSFCGTRMKGE